MSMPKRQRSCAVCGDDFVDGEPTELEPLVDGVIRWVCVHPGETTHPDHAAGGRTWTSRHTSPSSTPISSETPMAVES